MGQGQIGPRGPMGPMGTMGPIGLTGTMGLIGLTGPLGPMGTMGPIGLTGTMGPIGLTGTMGPMGIINDYTSLKSTLFTNPLASGNTKYGATLWCADGEFCQLPSGIKGITFNDKSINKDWFNDIESRLKKLETPVKK